MWGSNERGGQALLSGTLRLVAILGLCGYGLAIWLSQGGLDNPRLERIVTALRDRTDPVTTGSIGPAHGVKLDPCAVSRR